MKIQSVTVSHFGKLSDRTFRFSDGLNLIYGENESGKSTLAAYLKFMLYGFPQKGARNAAANDKLHYMPWNGGAASGKAELLLSDGTALSVMRSHGAKSTCTVVEPNTGRERNLGKPLGEELFGMDEASFSRMAFIREKNVSADRLEDLSESVQNIILSADESVNIEKAHKKLRDFRNVYRGRGKDSGKCAELERRIRELRYDFDKESELHKTLLSAEAKLLETRRALERNEAKQKELEKELENIEAFEAKKILDAVLQSKTALDAAKNAYDTVRAELSDGAVSAETPVRILDAAERSREAEEKKEQTADALRMLREELCEKETENELLQKAKSLSDAPETVLSEAKSLNKKAKKHGVLSLCFLGLSAVSAALYLARAFSGIDLVLALCGGVSALLFLTFTAVFFGKRTKMKSFLAENGFSSVSELAEFCTEYPKAQSALSELYAKEKILTEETEHRSAACENARRELRALLESCGAETDDPYGFVETMRKKLAVLSECKSEYERRESAYEAYLAANDLPTLNEKAKGFSETPKRDKKTVCLELEFLKKARLPLLEKEKEYIRAAAAPSSTRRKPAEILAERTALEATLQEAEQTADALELAMSALEEACEEMRCGVSPRIARRASELYREFTDGKGGSLLLTPEFSLSAEKDGLPREDGMLSAGTFDAAYLAVRIALCESLFREPPVLILDETFAHMDEKRMKRTLAALCGVANRFQIFLFSCHEREIEAVEEYGGNIVHLTYDEHLR